MKEATASPKGELSGDSWQHAPDYNQRFNSSRAVVRRAWQGRRRGVTGWGIACLSLMLALWVQYLTWTWKSTADEVYVLDRSGNIYFGSRHDLSAKSELFNLLASEATLVFFQRSVSGEGSLDREDLARRIYRKRAYDLLMEDLQRQRPDLKNRSLHQKVEIGRIRQLEEKSGSVYVLTEGQLVRAGHFKGHPVSEAEPFSLILRFVRNASLTPGAAPWVVEEWSRQLPQSY